jgi:hypothetical protein
MCDYKYELEDEYMKECHHEHWLKLCCDCGQVIEDEDIDYVATGFDSTTVYEEIIVT